MTATMKPFYCLRCGHEYRTGYEKGVVVERACPKCSSNSVRLVPEAAGKAAAPEDRG